MYQMSIVWPLIPGYGVLVCDGWLACRGLTFPSNPSETQPLTVTCDNPSECYGAKIYCPETQSCTLNCSDHQSCQQVCNS